MMKKRVILALFIPLGASLVFGSEPDLLSRKQIKEVQRIFSTFEKALRVTLPEDLPGSDSLVRQGDLLYSLESSDQHLGFLFSTRAKGRFEYFDYSIIFSADLAVQGIIVTTYRSTHGAGICNKKWLAQFEGYTGEELKLGKNIDSISGATLSAGSMVTDVRRSRNLMLSLQKQQVKD